MTIIDGNLTNKEGQLNDLTKTEVEIKGIQVVMEVKRVVDESSNDKLLYFEVCQPTSVLFQSIDFKDIKSGSLRSEAQIMIPIMRAIQDSFTDLVNDIV